MLTRCAPPLALAGLTLLFFGELVLRPTQILYADHSDLIGEHIPARRFQVRSFQRDGELPLWCPYSFGGSPFVHDIQVAAFYPPHLALLWLPEERVGAALSWLVVLHVLLAGWCTYGYARFRGLGRVAGCVAAAGYMFAGEWLLHVLAGGHYILIGLAWLPLVLLLLERAIREGGFRAATGAGVAFGLLTLATQPQWTFYAGLLVALWTFGAALESAGCWWTNAVPGRTPRGALLRWAGFGAWAALLGVGLAAVQLWPTWEASAYSSRANGVAATNVLGGGMQAFLFLVGPTLTAEPPNLQWEDRGGLTLLWLTAAVLAGVCGRGRLCYQAVVGLLLVLFAVGGAWLVQGLPGFRLFRQPTRMFVLVGFPVALLAGYTTEHLFGVPAEARRWRERGAALLPRLTLALLILAGGFALRSWWSEGKSSLPHPYWLSLPVTVPTLFWLWRVDSAWRRRYGVWLWCGLLLVDLWALTKPLVAVREEAPLYATSDCVKYLLPARPGEGRVLDRDGAEGDNAPLGAGSPLALVYGVESLRGHNPLDCLRYKEYLQFVRGGEGQLIAFGDPLTFPVVRDFPIENKPLLDLLGVRYLLQPRDEPPPPGDWELVIEDDAPAAFDVIRGGRRPLAPYRLYRNPAALPRAFVVHRAGALPERDVLTRLGATDFTEEVLLEHPAPGRGLTGDSPRRHVALTEYRPNAVRLRVDGGAPGWLVLADAWYPGWTCRVNGRSVAVERADYLFRAAELPPEECEVVFRFEPPSYVRGRVASLATLALAAAILLSGLAPARRASEGCARSRVGPVEISVSTAR